jgi:hypothetical protein
MVPEYEILQELQIFRKVSSHEDEKFSLVNCELFSFKNLLKPILRSQLHQPDETSDAGNFH